MAKVTLTESSLENIADAIRAKLGVQTTYKPGEMAAAIASIPTGGSVTIPTSIAVTTLPTKTTYTEGDSLDLTGIVVTATLSNGSTKIVTSSCTFSPADGDTLPTAGTQTVTVSYVENGTVSGGTFQVTLSASFTVSVTANVEIVPWSTGTDEQIVAMLQAAHNGIIDLQQDGGWAVGDERRIAYSAFTAYSGSNVSAGTSTIVISSFDDYNSCGCVMQIDFKTVIFGEMKMNTTNTNVGGYGETLIKNYDIPAFVEALPSWFKSALLSFSVNCFAGNGSSDIVSVSGNKLALRATVEVFGGTSGEGSITPYYSDSTHRDKGNRNDWWLRTPNSTSSFQSLSRAQLKNTLASATKGLSPFGCL